MNEAMPQWRTFTSEAPTQPGAPAPPHPLVAGNDERARLSATVTLLIGLAGAALGAAVILFIVFAGGLMPGVNLVGSVGEPLGRSVAWEASSLAVAEPDPRAVTAIAEIVVDVAGAVARPGLHRLVAGSRVGNAIEAAGGFSARVDLAETARALNLAELLEDGTKVLVPELGFDRSQAPATEDARIDINRADQPSLETLPGIGPVTAARIIDARSGARFDSVADLRSRGLVGESVFGQIKDMVRVNG